MGDIEGRLDESELFKFTPLSLMFVYYIFRANKINNLDQVLSDHVADIIKIHANNT